MLVINQNLLLVWNDTSKILGQSVTKNVYD